MRLTTGILSLALAFAIAMPAFAQTSSSLVTQVSLLERLVQLLQGSMVAQTSGTPDLVPANFSRNPSGTITEGSQVYFSAAVRNQGGDNPYAPWARFCIDNPNCLTSDTGHIGFDPSTTALNADQVSDTYTRAWNATAGTHTAYFCVNTGNPPVPESTLNNNCASLTFTVNAVTDTSSSARADLIPAGLSRSPSGTLTAGTEVTFTAAVRNQGTAEAPDSWARFCIDNSSCLTSTNGRLDPGHRLSESGNPLPAGQTSSSASRTWTATQGTHTIYFCADPSPSPQVNESNESNNCTSMTFSVGTAPVATPADFSAINLTRSPSGTITAGQLMTFSGSVRNVGATRSVGGPWVRFCLNNADCLNNDAGYIGSDQTIPALDPNSSASQARTWTAVAGNHTVYMCANTGNPRVTEGSLSNNCTSLSFSVNAPVEAPTLRADLIPINLMRSPSGAITAGQPVVFSAAVRNYGNATAPDSWARFCIDSRGEGDCYGSANTRLGDGHRLSTSGGSLGSNQTSRTMTSSTWTATAGTHTIYFCADPSPSAQVTESNEDNNCTSLTFSVNAATVSEPIVPPVTTIQPDLYVSGFSASPAGAVYLGTPISVMGYVGNAGGVANSSFARICVDNENCTTSTSGRLGTDQSIPSLQQSQTHGLVTRSWVPSSAGTYTVYFCTDVTRALSESNENNNCAQVTVTVVSQTQVVPPVTTIQPDLNPVNFTRLGTGIIRAGDPVTFLSNVRNLGGVAGTSQARFCVDNDECLDSSAGTIGSIHTIGIMSQNTVSTPVAATWTATGGTHTIYFCADVSRAVTESNEDNNCTSFPVYVEGTAAQVPIVPVTPTVPVVPTYPIEVPDIETPIIPTPIGQHDLVPTGVARIGTGPITTGSYVTFIAYIRNIGNAPAPDSWARFCIDNPNCLTNANGRLNPGHRVSAQGLPLQSGETSLPVSRTWTAVAGNHTLYFCVNTDNVAVEVNRDNNCASIELEVSGAVVPPVVPVVPVVPVEPVIPPVVGGSAEFGFTVQMQGSSNTADGPVLADFKRAIDDIAGEVAWVRLYVQEWDTMLNIASPTNITFNQPHIDRYKEAVAYAKSKGLKVQLNLIPRLNGRSQQFSHSEYLELTRTHMNYLASQFAGNVDLWQVTNEANITDYRTGNHLWEPNWTLPDLRPGALANRTFSNWDSADTLSMRTSYLSELGQTMAVARSAIRAHSNAPITMSISGAPGVTEAMTAQNLDRLFAFIDAVRPSVDWIGMDVYLPGQNMDANYQRAFDQIPSFFGQLKNRYPEKRVYTAETGMASEGPGRSESQQTDIVLKSAQAISAAGISPILVYEYRDSDWSNIGSVDFETTENSFGLVRKGSDSRKPAYSPVMNYLSANGTGIGTPTAPQQPQTPQQPVYVPPVQTPVLPELRVEGLTRLTNTLTVGTPITFMANVRNTGGIADVFYTRFCLNNESCTSSSGRIGGIDPLVTGITAGGLSAPVSIVWSPTAGDHRVYFCADVTNLVGESNENNNCSSISFKVTAPVVTQPTVPTQPTTPTTPTQPQTPQTSAVCTVRTISDSEAQGLGLDPWYDKYCDYKGMRFAASSATPNAAVAEAARLASRMLEKRADVFVTMNGNGHRVGIMSKNEVTTDIPEHRNLYSQFPGTDWDNRARGLGGTTFMPYSTAAEENLLCYTADRYRGESVFVHEFAHSILNLGLDGSFVGRVQQAYQVAMSAGLWANTYARTNHEEYWAEGVQSYFNTNLQATNPNGIHNYVNTKSELQQYDLNLYNLVHEAFAGSTFSYSCP